MSKQVLQFLKRHPLLLLLLLAVIQTAGILVFLSQRHVISSTRSPIADATATTPPQRSPSPLPTVSIPPDLTDPSALTESTASPAAKPGKSATKSSAPAASPSPSPEAKPKPPALTAEQQALNQQYKQTIHATSSVDAMIEMRVAIAEGVPSLAMGSSTAATLMDQDRNPLITLTAGEGYRVEPSGSGISVNGKELPHVLLLEPNDGGLFTLGDRTYRGRLIVVNDAGKLWAVNFVNLRNYLHSVVASEVSPSWQAEALKAQAVAARSYALTYYFKPMSSLFHLGATEYYQVYSGIGREAAETNQAVDATAGEFVSYRGGIVESLYAASDDIVAEAFRGHGMSQLGALNLAEQGYSYLQILANYYPGTSVAKFVRDHE